MHLAVRHPLTFLSSGVVLVALDFRTDLPDLLPDPVGWALIAVGAWALALRPAALLAVIAALLSLSDAALPYRYVSIDPVTGEVVNDTVGEAYDLPVQQRWPDVSDERALAIGAAVAVGGLALWLVVRELADQSARAGNGSVARRLRVFALAVPLVWAAPTLALVGVGVGGDDGYDPVWDGNLEYAGLIGMLVLVGLAVSFVLDRDEPWARSPDARPTPAAGAGPQRRADRRPGDMTGGVRS